MKKALVTGASSDIGQEIVRSFLNQGIHVIGLYSNNTIGLDNENLLKEQVDFTNSTKTSQFIENLIEKNSDIEYLINCSGYIENQNFLEVDSEEILKTFQINLFSHIEIMKRIFQKMCALKRGRIISLSSIGVKFSGSNNSVYYSASKASLEAVTKSFAKFGASKNVLCNNIRVGVIDTKIHRNKDMQTRVGMIPVKRIGKTSDIVNMVNFLCSEESSFITGQDFAVSGGE